MLFEKVDTEDITSSLNGVSSLDGDFDTMRLESDSYDPEDNTINPIDCYQHFIMNEIIDLMIRETNRYAQQYLENHETSRRSIFHQWKPTTNEEMLKFFGIIIEVGSVQMPKLKYYWSSSNELIG